MGEGKRRYLVITVCVVAVLSLAVCTYLSLSPDAPAGEPEFAEVNRQAAARDVEGLKQSASSNAVPVKVAARAVQALAQVSRQEAAADIQRFMSDPRPAVRAEAAGGWAYVGTPRNIQPLAQLINKDPSPSVRIAGLQAMDALKAWDGLPTVLDRMAEDNDPAVRRAAMQTFEQVAFLRVGKTYKPDGSVQSRRAAVAPLREFVKRPVAREMYAEWAASKSQSGAQ